MKLLVDANILLDVLQNREPHVAELEWGDFEDAIQSVTAERIHADYIITKWLLQSPMYFRLRLRLLLMPAHACGIRQYLIIVPIIHMDCGTHTLRLELGFIWLAKQNAQPPLVSLP